MAKAKGTTLVGAVRMLRKHKDRARELLPPALHHYLEERVAESRWYPEADLEQILAAVVAMLPGDRARVLEELGAASAREHLDGIYSHLSGGGAHGLSRRAVALWSSQHDTGRFEITPVSSTENIMTVRDFGHPSEIMCGILGGYLAEAMRFEGAIDVEVHKESCVLRGDAECSWRRRWTRSDPGTKAT